MTNKKSVQVGTNPLQEKIVAARGRAAAIVGRLQHKPGPDELLTPQELADAAPFYLALRDYIRQMKAARDAAGLTLEQISLRSGLELECLTQLETGAQTNPTWKTLALYAAALGRRPRIELDEAR